MKRTILFLAGMLLTAPCCGITITVDDDGPADFDSIRAAVIAASAGDTIFVKSGYYSPTTNGESFPITLKAGLTLVGEDASTTIINSDNTSSKVIQTDDNCVISGLSVGLNFVPGDWGEIISCSSTNVLIENNIIMNSPGTSSIWCYDANEVVIRWNVLSQIVSCFYSSDVTVRENVFAGSGLRFYATTGEVVRNEIISPYQGAGVYCYNGSALIANNVIRDCWYRAIDIGYYCTNVVIKNNSIVEHGGGGIYLQSAATVRNNIISDVSGVGIDCQEETESAISFNNLWNNGTDFVTCNGAHDNLFVDPCFADAGEMDYHLRSEGWRWDSGRENWTWDEVTSRCIDSGNPGSPLGDEPLSVPPDPNNDWGRNLRINMGAYGGTVEASMPPHDWAFLGDLTNDGRVDFDDAAEQMGHWQSSGEEQAGDLDRNGMVDFADFALLAETWFETTSWY